VTCWPCTRTVPTDPYTSTRPPVALPRAPAQPSGHCDEIASAASYTNTWRSHDVTGFWAPAGMNSNPAASTEAPAGNPESGVSSGRCRSQEIKPVRFGAVAAP